MALWCLLLTKNRVLEIVDILHMLTTLHILLFCSCPFENRNNIVIWDKIPHTKIYHIPQDGVNFFQHKTIFKDKTKFGNFWQNFSNKAGKAAFDQHLLYFMAFFHWTFNFIWPEKQLSVIFHSMLCLCRDRYKMS